MVGIVWDEKQKSHEWSIAKKELSDSNGRLLPNGAKLTRKKSGLHHSFIVIDNKIVALNAKDTYLGKGVDGKVKLAEDEKGRLIALKIAIQTKGDFSRVANEESIAHDLGIAGKKTTRVNRKEEKKEYLAYKYLGTPFNNYINENSYTSLDERYEICIKVALILHDLHSGAKSKTNAAYLHGDFHCANIVIDDAGNPHIIDFGRSSAGKYNGRSVVMNENNKLANQDTVKLLSHFYKPPNKRDFNEGEFFGILGDAMPEYKLSTYGKKWFKKSN